MFAAQITDTLSVTHNRKNLSPKRAQLLLTMYITLPRRECLLSAIYIPRCTMSLFTRNLYLLLLAVISNQCVQILELLNDAPHSNGTLSSSYIKLLFHDFRNSSSNQQRCGGCSVHKLELRLILHITLPAAVGTAPPLVTQKHSITLKRTALEAA